jgi:DNA repair exonuclease SbcCD ATPase subunit
MLMGIRCIFQASCDELHCDFTSLRESNRLLFEEVQAHRKSAEQALKQCMRVELENKDLLEATRIYKIAIADRDDDIEKYKAVLKKNRQKLQQRNFLQQVEENLRQQLTDTKALVVAASQRLEHSSSGGDASDHQVNNYLRRIELAPSRWSELLTQSQHLQEQLDERLSRGGNGPRKPQWVDDIKRQFSNLRADITSFSRAMHDLLHDFAGLLRQDHRGGGANTEPNLPASVRRSLRVMHSRRFVILSNKLDELKRDIQHQHTAAQLP